MKSAKDIIKNLSVAILALLIGLAICESIVRVNAKSLMPPWYYLKSEPMTHSPQGFRGGKIYKQEKPRSVMRIMGLGDSFTYGQYVKERDTYLSLLGRKLGEDSDAPYEVINAGRAGYNTVDELRFFLEKGQKYGPDIVILAVTFDDVNLGNFNPPKIFPRLEKNLKSSYLYAFLRYRYRYILQRLCGRSFDRTDVTALSYKWLAFSRAMEIFSDINSQTETRVIVVILPYTDVMLKEPYPLSYFNDRVAGLCGELKLPILDLTPYFYNYIKEHHVNPDVFWALIDPPDYHPSPLAHKLIAEALFSFLKERGLLESK